MCTVGFLTYRRPGGRYDSLAYARRLADVGRRLGITVVAFSVDDLLPEGGAVSALRFTPHGAPRRQTLPMPDVVYDFVRHHPTAAFRRYAEARRQALWPSPSRLGSNKWTHYKALRKTPLSRHLPETVLWDASDARKTEKLLRRLLAGGDVVVKPANGTGGRRIALIRAGTPLSEARVFLSRHYRRRKTLLQRYIPHAVGDFVYDIRLLVQKNAAGAWAPTGIGVRRNARHALVTNLARGGRAVRLHEYLINARGFSTSEAENIEAELLTFGLQVAAHLDRSLESSLVELGLDLVLDPEGTPYLLEANTKPDRKTFLRLGDRAAYGLAHARPLLYLCAWAENNASTRWAYKKPSFQ